MTLSSKASAEVLDNRKMSSGSLLVACNLYEKPLYNHMKPLTDLGKIARIDLVRDQESISLPKLNYIVPKRKTRLRIVRSIQKLLLLGQYCRRNDYDYLISFYLFPHGLYQILLGSISRKRTIVCLIGTDIHSYLKSWLSPILIRILKMATLITVPGSQSEKCLMSRGIENKKVVILPNAINTTVFRPARSEKEIDVIFIGRLVKVKNVDTILKAVAHLREEYPRIRVAIVGDGPEKESLQKLSYDLDLEKNVEFLGYREDISDLLEKSRIFLMASKSEGMPFSLIEAMCCGVVPVVPCVGDISDIVNRENAMIINGGGDHKEYSEAIMELLGNESLYRRLSEKASDIREYYSFPAARKVWDRILQ